MKIALMLHGQGRFIFKGYNSLKKILDNYDVDVYCQVWWDDDIKSNGYIGAKGKYSVDEYVPDDIKNLYSPKKLLINKPHNFLNLDDSIFFEHPNLKLISWPSREHHLSQFLSLKLASNMFNWLDYDLIIRTRYDVHLINLPNLLELDSTKFYPASNTYGTFSDVNDFFCDNFFIMSNDMSIYGNIFDLLGDNLKYRHTSMTTEDLYSYYLEDMGFSNKLIKLDTEKLKFDIYV